METRANNALIGLFTLAVVIAAAAFVMWFARAADTNKVDQYRVVFSGSITGLTVGSNVLLNGIRVGQVDSLEVSPQDPTQVVGQISVNPPATLTIEPGSLILGQTIGSFLVIERGADIQANGTRAQPIVFTSAAPCGQQLPGDWGGVVIHGLAQANCADLPPAQGGTGCRTTDGINSCISEGGAGSFHHRWRGGMRDRVAEQAEQQFPRRCGHA